MNIVQLHIVMADVAGRTEICRAFTCPADAEAYAIEARDYWSDLEAENIAVEIFIRPTQVNISEVISEVIRWNG